MKLNKESSFDNIEIKRAPVVTAGVFHDIYSNPLYHTIRSNIITKQSYLINHFHDMTFVASCADYAFVLAAPFKTYTSSKKAEEREKNFQEDKAFTANLFKKNILISKSLDAKEKSRREFFEAVRIVYPSFGMDIEKKISPKDYELLHSVRKKFKQIFSTGASSYDTNIRQNEKLLFLQDKLSEIIDSESFAKACNIEDTFMINEINKFFELLPNQDSKIKQSLGHKTLKTHDGKKISPINLAHSIRNSRIKRVQIYNQILSLYQKLGNGKEIKILLKQNENER